MVCMVGIWEIKIAKGLQNNLSNVLVRHGSIETQNKNLT